MTRKGLSRRAVLRGAGGIAFALPFLESMNAQAATAVGDRCAMFIFTPNGVVPDRWFPTGTETNWTLNTSTQLLSPIKGDVILIKGIQQAVGGPGDPHQRGLAAFLTGEELLPGTEFGVGEDPNTRVGWGGGISIDQHLAKKVGQSSPIPVLNLGVGCREYRNHGRMSYLGPNQPVANDQNPRNVFDRIFSNFDPGSQPNTATFERIRQEKRSVIDFVKADLARLRKKVSSADRVKLERHAETVRQLETRIATLGQGEPSVFGSTCAKEPNPGTDSRFNTTDYRDVGRLMLDLSVVAMACRRTRIITMQWSNGVSEQTFPWLSVNGAAINDGHHSLSHGMGTDVNNKLQAIDRWYCEQFVYLVQKMKTVTFAGGETLLDRSVVYWGNEIAEGGSHALGGIPIVIAGKCGGAIRPGRYLQLGGERSNNDVLVSVQNMLGVPDPTFGRANRNSAPFNLG